MRDEEGGHWRRCGRFGECLDGVMMIDTGGWPGKVVVDGGIGVRCICEDEMNLHLLGRQDDCIWVELDLFRVGSTWINLGLVFIIFLWRRGRKIW